MNAGSPCCWVQTSFGGSRESTRESTVQMHFIMGWGGPSGRLPRAPHMESPWGQMRGSMGSTCYMLVWGQGPLLSKACCGQLQHTAPTPSTFPGLGSSIELAFQAKLGSNKHWQVYYLNYRSLGLILKHPILFRLHQRPPQPQAEVPSMPQMTSEAHQNQGQLKGDSRGPQYCSAMQGSWRKE